MANSTLQKFLDAGVHFTEMSSKQAESLVKSLVKTGEVRRQDAEDLVQSLVERGRDTTERISTQVRDEVSKQYNAMTERFDELEARLESLADRVGVTDAKPSAKKAAATTAAATAATKKAPAKKKAAAKKKAPAKKAAAGTSGVRSVDTRRTV